MKCISPQTWVYGASWNNAAEFPPGASTYL